MKDFQPIVIQKNNLGSEMVFVMSPHTSYPIACIVMFVDITCMQCPCSLQCLNHYNGKLLHMHGTIVTSIYCNYHARMGYCCHISEIRILRCDPSYRWLPVCTTLYGTPISAVMTSLQCHCQFTMPMHAQLRMALLPCGAGKKAAINGQWCV